jgi:hypothetical protein
MTMPLGDGRSLIVQTRLTVPDHERMMAVAAALTRVAHGLRLQRAEVARLAILKGLDVLEAELGLAPKPRAKRTTKPKR